MIYRIYRPNPALPPRFGSVHVAVTMLGIEAAIREVLTPTRRPQSQRLLARYDLDTGARSDLVCAVREAAPRHIARLTDVVGVKAAPLGTGRPNARDCGGRLLAVLEPWVTSGRPALLGFRGGLPWDDDQRRIWEIAHPEVARLFRPSRKNEWPAIVTAAIRACEIRRVF